MIGLPFVPQGEPAGTRIWIVAGVTDMRRGFLGLAAMVQTAVPRQNLIRAKNGASSRCECGIHTRIEPDCIGSTAQFSVPEGPRLARHI